MAENIRIMVFGLQNAQFSYTHKIYEFQTAHNHTIEPIRLQEIHDENDPFPNNLMFEHEWSNKRKYVLHAGNAAVILVKTNLFDFEMNSNNEFNIFVRYNIYLENGSYKELQLHAGNIVIDTDILQDERYLISFDTANGKFTFIFYY